MQTPREVRAHIRAERDPVAPPREIVDTPRAHCQVPSSLISAAQSAVVGFAISRQSSLAENP
eukprot:4613189-Alexandrium_andersonii.AAC.1